MKSVPTARKASAIVALVVVATAIAMSRWVAGLAGASWSPFDGAAGRCQNVGSASSRSRPWLLDVKVLPAA